MQAFGLQSSDGTPWAAPLQMLAVDVSVIADARKAPLQGKFRYIAVRRYRKLMAKG